MNITIAAEKQEIRTEALRRRDAISEGERFYFSEIIAHSVLNQLAQWDASTIHIYLNYRSEVSTRQLIGEVLKRGCQVIAPVMVNERGVETLHHAKLTSLENIIAGPYGIYEPIGMRLSDPGSIDAVVLPVAAFDRTGARLGYGRGFYDRFLSGLSAHTKKIGIAFSVQEFSKIPQEPHDVLLDVVVTEKEVIFCKEERV